MLLAAGAATAQSNFRGHDWAETGGYLFLGGLTAWQDLDDTANINNPQPASDFSTSLGFTIKGGYRFIPYLAAEVEANFLSGFDTRVLTPAGSGLPPSFALTDAGTAREKTERGFREGLGPPGQAVQDPLRGDRLEGGHGADD